MGLLGHLVLLSWIAGLSSAAKFGIQAHQKQCISQTIESDHFERKGAAADAEVKAEAGIFIQQSSKRKPNLNSKRSVDVELFDPRGVSIFKQTQVWTDLRMSETAKGEGSYELCFSNNSASRAEVWLELSYFTLLHGDALPVEEGLRLPGLASDAPAIAQHVHLTHLDDEIKRLKELIKRLDGHAAYFRSRLRRHLSTQQSTHRRATVYAGLETLALAAIMGAQVLTIKFLFSSDKRFGGRKARVSGMYT